MRSRHQNEVATEEKQLIEHLCHDIRMQSQHQQGVRSSRDGSLQGNDGRDKNKRSRQQFHRREVATTSGCRDNNSTKGRLRQHLVVVTSIAKTGGRDNRNKERRSRQHLVVATAAAKIKGSRQDQAVATPASWKTCRNQTEPLRHN